MGSLRGGRPALGIGQPEIPWNRECSAGGREGILLQMVRWGGEKGSEGACQGWKALAQPQLSEGRAL